MSSEDLDWLAGLSIAFSAFAIGAIVLLILVVLAIRRLIPILHADKDLIPYKETSLMKLSIGLMTVGLIFLLHFWYAGGPNTGNAIIWFNNKYLEAQLGVGLIFFGVIVAFFLPNYRLKPIKTGWSWPRRHKWLTLLALIVMVIIGAIIYFRIDLELNRRSFQQASNAIDTIYADIVKEIGPPDDGSSSRSCGGFRGVYGEGPINCYISKFFIYGLSNIDQSNQTVEKIKSIITRSQSTLEPTSSPEELTGVNTKAPGNTSVTDYYLVNGGIECKAVYEFDTSYGSVLKLKDPKDKRLAINISCEGPARAKYF